MEMMRIEQLRALARECRPNCASIYMPIQGPGRDTRQNSIRLKNLLAAAAEMLRAESVRTAAAKRILRPARRLVRLSSFWRTSAGGLALYLADGLFQFFRVPLVFPERMTIARQFELSPILPLFSAGGRFYVLTISQKRVRLFEATATEIEEIGLEGIPHNLQDTLKYDVRERQRQLHTSGAKPAIGRKESAVFHAQAEGVDNARERVLDYFRQVDRGVCDLLKDGREPMVLAGVEDLHPIYREVNTYPHLVVGGVSGNQDMARPDELRRAAWEVIRPRFEQAREQAVERYKALIGTPKASDHLAEILPATVAGKVDFLLIGPEARRWGRFDPQMSRVEIHSMPESGDEDLINTVAIETILHRGAVYAAGSRERLIESPVGAVYRFAA